MTLKTDVESGASGYSVTGGGDQGIFVKQVLKDSSAAKLFDLREGTTALLSLGFHHQREDGRGKQRNLGWGCFTCGSGWPMVYVQPLQAERAHCALIFCQLFEVKLGSQTNANMRPQGTFPVGPVGPGALSLVVSCFLQEINCLVRPYSLTI